MTTCKRCYYSREHCICKRDQTTAPLEAPSALAVQPVSQPNTSSLSLFKLVEVPHLECVLCLKLFPPGRFQRIERKRHGEIHVQEGRATAHQDQNDPLCVSFFLK
jgi:hypothetical protein